MSSRDIGSVDHLTAIQLIAAARCAGQRSFVAVCRNVLVEIAVSFGNVAVELTGHDFELCFEILDDFLEAGASHSEACDIGKDDHFGFVH